MKEEEIIKLDKKYIQRKKFMPFVIKSTEGCTIKDVKGKEYLDFLGGYYGTVTIGWNRKEVLNAMKKQMRYTNFAPEYCPSEACSKLAKELIKLTDKHFRKCLRATSGSEAVDLAIKSAKASSGKKRIITSHNSYHGQTIAGIALGGHRDIQGKIKPVLPKIVKVPFPNSEYCRKNKISTEEAINQFEKTVKKKEDIAAALFEPILGEGIIVPPKNYFKKIENICKENSIQLIFDEVITGFGRTGEPFAYQTFKVKPDILILGKGLSSGYAPIATTL